MSHTIINYSALNLNEPEYIDMIQEVLDFDYKTYFAKLKSGKIIIKSINGFLTGIRTLCCKHCNKSINDCEKYYYCYDCKKQYCTSCCDYHTCPFEESVERENRITDVYECDVCHECVTENHYHAWINVKELISVDVCDNCVYTHVGTTLILEHKMKKYKPYYACDNNDFGSLLDWYPVYYEKDSYILTNLNVDSQYYSMIAMAEKLHDGEYAYNVRFSVVTEEELRELINNAKIKGLHYTDIKKKQHTEQQDEL